MKHKLMSLAAATAVFAGGAFALDSAAQATTAAPSVSATGPTGTLTAHAPRSVHSPNAAASVILCDAREALAISNPHHSHHEPRNVNVIATVTCSKAVPNITLTVRLDRNGKRVNAKTFSKSGKNFLKGNASSGCKGKVGTYQGFADVRVTFPPGYTPPVGSAHLASKAVPVHCF